MPELTEAVKQLQNQMHEYAEENPHIRPSSIMQNSDGADEVLSADAANIWREILGQRPDDPVAHHHLAVIHHGRAFRFFADGQLDAEQSIDDWQQALNHWCHLIEDDGFWARLQTIWQERRENGKGDLLAERLLEFDLNSFRRQLPASLLRVHIELIQSVARDKPTIARTHLKLIRESGFEAGEIDRALKRVYGLLVGSVEDLPVPDAKQQIESFLKIEPDNVDALCDRLRLAVRASKKKGSVDRRGRTAVMKEAEAFAQRLAGMTSHHSDLFVTDAIRDFHLECGEIHDDEGEAIWKEQRVNAIREFTQAAECFFKACRFDKTGQSAARKLRKSCIDVSDLSKNDDTHRRPAIALVKRYLDVSPQHPCPHLLLAMLLAHDDKQKEAMRELDEADRLNKASPDSFVTERATKLRADLKSEDFQAQIHVNAADDAIGRDAHYEALRELKNARQAQKKKTELTTYIVVLQALTHLLAGDRNSASDSYREAVNLQRQYPNPMAQQFISQFPPGF